MTYANANEVKRGDRKALRKVIKKIFPEGLRTLITSMDFYEAGKELFSQGVTPMDKRNSLSPVRQIAEIGCLTMYGIREAKLNRGRKRTSMNVSEMVGRWKKLVVGLTLAHDKDEADRYEAAIEECLNPLCAAPSKQLREFATAFRNALREDKSVPYLVWRAYEFWIDQIVLPSPDEGFRELKTALAQEIVEMVEEDAKRDLPAAMVRALQWRSAGQLEKVKEVVVEEKKAGRTTRLRGRESCLFLEAGGTEKEPKVCVQV